MLELLIAAFLHALAKDHGLSSSSSLPSDPIERLEFPSWGLSLISEYLPGLKNEDPEQLRSQLHVEFVQLADDKDTRATLGTRNLTPVGVLAIAQVFWNLDADPDEGRGGLPLVYGRRVTSADGSTSRADISIKSCDEDFALLKYARRMELGTEWPGGSLKGGAMRNAGARLAGLVAQSIAKHIPLDEIDSIEVNIGMDERGKYFLAPTDLGSSQQPVEVPELYSNVRSKPNVPSPEEPNTNGLVRLLEGFAEVGATYSPRDVDKQMEQFWKTNEDRRVWLSGLPGSGKSFIARKVMQEAISRSVEDPSTILIWISSATQASVQRTFASAARQLGLENPSVGRLGALLDSHEESRYAEALLKFLTFTQRSWLIVFDDADPQLTVATNLLPPGNNPNGRFIGTTLPNVIPNGTTGRHLRVETLTPSEVKDYFETLAPSFAVHEQDQLSSALAGHPLSLAVAIHDIATNGIGVDGWLAKFTEARELRKNQKADDPSRSDVTSSHLWNTIMQRTEAQLPNALLRRTALVTAVHGALGHEPWIWDLPKIQAWIQQGETNEHEQLNELAVQCLLGFGAFSREHVNSDQNESRFIVHQSLLPSILDSSTAEELSGVASILIFEYFKAFPGSTFTEQIPATYAQRLKTISTFVSSSSEAHLVSEALSKLIAIEDATHTRTQPHPQDAEYTYATLLPTIGSMLQMDVKARMKVCLAFCMDLDWLEDRREVKEFTEFVIDTFEDYFESPEVTPHAKLFNARYLAMLTVARPELTDDLDVIRIVQSQFQLATEGANDHPSNMLSSMRSYLVVMNELSRLQSGANLQIREIDFSVLEKKIKGVAQKQDADELSDLRVQLELLLEDTNLQLDPISRRNFRQLLRRVQRSLRSAELAPNSLTSATAQRDGAWIDQNLHQRDLDPLTLASQSLANARKALLERDTDRCHQELEESISYFDLHATYADFGLDTASRSSSVYPIMWGSLLLNSTRPLGFSFLEPEVSVTQNGSKAVDEKGPQRDFQIAKLSLALSKQVGGIGLRNDVRVARNYYWMAGASANSPKQLAPYVNEGVELFEILMNYHGNIPELVEMYRLFLLVASHAVIGIDDSDRAIELFRRRTSISKLADGEEPNSRFWHDKLIQLQGFKQAAKSRDILQLWVELIDPQSDAGVTLRGTHGRAHELALIVLSDILCTVRSEDIRESCVDVEEFYQTLTRTIVILPQLSTESHKIDAFTIEWLITCLAFSFHNIDSDILDRVSEDLLIRLRASEIDDIDSPERLELRLRAHYLTMAATSHNGDSAAQKESLESAAKILSHIASSGFSVEKAVMRREYLMLASLWREFGDERLAVEAEIVALEYED